MEEGSEAKQAAGGGQPGPYNASERYEKLAAQRKQKV